MNILPRQMPTETGFEPLSDNARFQTSKIWLPPLPQEVGYMHEVAKEIALITGRKVEFKDHRDNDCAVWGDYGSFIIK